MAVKTLIMAAGAGTRMKSELPKVLQQVCGRSLVEWVLSVSYTHLDVYKSKVCDL